MNLPDNPNAASTLDKLQALGLLAPAERGAILQLGASGDPFADALEAAETIHLHIKVDNTDQLPINDFFDAGARLDHQKAGFVKYRFPGEVNAIFSHIKVSQDELAESESNRRPRPFLDHIGIDLRDESDSTRAIFDSIPKAGAQLDWAVASQGGGGRAVYCCHVEVAEKHWLYPAGDEHQGIPLEFAFGALKVNPETSGCDLRPSNPRTADPDSAPCCGATTATVDAYCAGEGAPDSYYQPADLGRFREIGRENPALAEAFFAYYGKVKQDGVLAGREKALIALAVAHALKCPYCIDAASHTCRENGRTEAEMLEAVHVAAASAAGITLIHATQMLGHLDRLDRPADEG